MKKIAALLLILCLAVPLLGCQPYASSLKDPVTFYYYRREFQYGTEDGVIASEQREASGHKTNLSYLISLYLVGPIDETLANPFPINTKMLGYSQDDSGLTVEITDTGRFLTDSYFSLSCTCLSMTCMELAKVDSVTIVSGSRTLTTTRDNVLLIDSCTAEQSAG